MKMKRGMTILSAAALTFAMAGPVMAQAINNGAAANADYSFFDSHPNVARALRQDPTLIDNQQWVDEHPALHDYLKTHPNVRHEFKSHPYWFMHRSEEIQKEQAHPGGFAHGAPPPLQPHPGEFAHGAPPPLQPHPEFTHGAEPYQKHHD